MLDMFKNQCQDGGKKPQQETMCNRKHSGVLFFLINAKRHHVISALFTLLIVYTSILHTHSNIYMQLGVLKLFTVEI